MRNYENALKKIGGANVVADAASFEGNMKLSQARASEGARDARKVKNGGGAATPRPGILAFQAE